MVSRGNALHKGSWLALSTLLPERRHAQVRNGGTALALFL